MTDQKPVTIRPEVDRRLRRLARQRGISQSAPIAEAIGALHEPSDQVRNVLAFAGAIEDAPPRLSEEVDETLYG